ncbi:phosphate starvation-inducible protein PhoH [Salsuginibacillus halophilus]|uniref:PhoH-like protein n=1 Tax=Salsuginibacillus halophilus TaxID=517424 RepID=A0A2P8HFL3_9BACI|nr:PhoH family protein [Salsuginibacillus halophilus]PSL45022.1 phosphate starvation-inducible protein PhoH [Salsuginibacillus halophilus]
MTDKHREVIQLGLKDAPEAQALFGPGDVHLKRIEEKLDVSIITRGESLVVTGEKREAQTVSDVMEALIHLLRQGVHISERDVLYAVQLKLDDQLDQLYELYQEQIATNAKGKPILVKTLGQKDYVRAIRKHDLVFGIGPAGTGKTYLAVVLAVAALKQGDVQRIVLTRPAVEAGENLGFLPGDLKEKVDPYLRPLYDALHDIFGAEHTDRLMERGTIEVAPLAYMRGRTLDDAFVILDEAQNTTAEQMKMFLTRLGFGSKMIVNGDLTQVDLPRGQKSGLKTVEGILKDVNEIGFVYLQGSDVVRHTVVQRILEAYDAVEDR